MTTYYTPSALEDSPLRTIEGPNGVTVRGIFRAGYAYTIVFTATVPTASFRAPKKRKAWVSPYGPKQ